jgi:hypothetical protein
MNQFSNYEKFEDSLSQDQKKELRSNIFFLRTAMICEMSRLIETIYKSYVDSNGYAEFYLIAMEICDEVLLTNESEYMKYIVLYFAGDEEADEYFHNNFDTCTDWYFMGLAANRLAETLGDYKGVNI